MPDPEGELSSTSDVTSRKRPQRVDSHHALPSERFAFDVHFTVLRNAVLRSSFGQKALSTDVIEEGTRAQAASLNVAFFVETGLMQKENRMYTPTAACVRFVKLLGIDEEKAKEALRGIIGPAWFTQVVSQYLQFYSAADDIQLMKELALSAEVSDFAAKERSFRILLDYLAWSGITIREGTRISLLSAPVEPLYSDAAIGTAIPVIPAARSEIAHPANGRETGDEFPLPVNGYETLRKILRAFYRVGRGTGTLALKEVASSTGINYTTISGNSKFFTAIGILRKEGSGFALTPKGGELGLAIDYEDQPAESAAWAVLLAEVPFIQRLLTRLDFARNPTVDDLAREISKAAKIPADKNPVGAAALADLLSISRLVQENGDGRVAPAVRTQFGSASLPQESASVVSKAEGGSDGGRLPEYRGTSQSALLVNLNVTLSLTPDLSEEQANRLLDYIKRLKAVVDGADERRGG